VGKSSQDRKKRMENRGVEKRGRTRSQTRIKFNPTVVAQKLNEVNEKWNEYYQMNEDGEIFETEEGETEEGETRELEEFYLNESVSIPFKFNGMTRDQAVSLLVKVQKIMLWGLVS